MALTRVAALSMDIRSPEGVPADPRADLVDCYALTQVDLSQYAGLLIGPQVDQEFLSRHRAVIRGYLNGGGTVVFGGHLCRDWLPGAGMFVPVPDRRRSTFRIVRIADHPIFRGLTPEDLTWRKGVAGFFARGHHPVPEGAQVLAWLNHERPATYLDRVSTRGTILVHATADLTQFVGARVVDWILAEVAARDRPAPSGGLAVVWNGSSMHHRALTEPKYAQHLTGGQLYLPDLAGTDLTGYDGLIIPERLHRGLLTQAAPRILELLEAGGLVVACGGGEPIPEFLPGVRWEHRPTNFWWWLDPDPAEHLRLTSPVPEHPFFDEIPLKDCRWHYHGALTPPEGAQTLVQRDNGEVLVYLDRVSTPGTLIVATLDPLSHYGSYFMPATERFLDGFMPWVAAQARTVHAAGAGG